MTTKATKIPDGKSWEQELINFYSEGYSDAEVAKEMKITIREYYKQIDESAVFAKLVEYGRTLSLAWWESQARLNINNKQFNTPLWVFTMKNKYGWADKVETNSTVENTNVDLDTLRQQTAQKISKFVAANHPELASTAAVLLSTVDTGGDNDE